MGIRHPIERFTSSSVTYDGIFEVFQAARRDRNAEAVHRPLKPQGSIRIENDVWIGAQVTLKPGIKVGNGAVIGMKAVVTKDVPPYAIVGGIPAKVIKYRFPDSVISDLLDLAWWKYNCFDFNGFSFDQPIEVFVEYLKEHIRNNAITEYRPKSLGASDLEKAAR